MKYYVIDVFTNELFKGNPAGVCVLEKWLNDTSLQKSHLKITYQRPLF